MPLFFDYSRPGPGVSPDEPRKTGLPRIWEMISRDYMRFWLSGLINLLFSLAPHLRWIACRAISRTASSLRCWQA